MQCQLEDLGALVLYCIAVAVELRAGPDVVKDQFGQVTRVGMDSIT